MAFEGNNCAIFRLSPEQLENLCSYMTPDSVCQLEQTCSQLQERMDQESIWRKQVNSFPVIGIPFGDSSEATFNKCGRRFDYFNQRVLKNFTDDSKRFGWHNPYRIALRTKFLLDKLLGDVKHFVENHLDEALVKLKEEARMNPERDWLFEYPLKTWQVKVDLNPSESECHDYLRKWMVHGEIIPYEKKIDYQISRNENVFQIESHIFQENLMVEESDTESENDTSDVEVDGVETFDSDSVTDEEEGNAEDLE